MRFAHQDSLLLSSLVEEASPQMYCNVELIVNGVMNMHDSDVTRCTARLTARLNIYFEIQITLHLRVWAFLSEQKQLACDRRGVFQTVLSFGICRTPFACTVLVQ